MAKNKQVDILSEQFVIELFKACFDKRDIFEVVRSYIKPSYLQDEGHKKLWKEANMRYTLNNKPPTLGILQQEFRNDHDMLELIAEIKETEIEDYEQIILGFYDFLKQLRFLELNDKIVEEYNKGNRQKSFDLLISGAEELNNFSIRDKLYEKVFEGFSARHTQRIISKRDKDIKIPTGIDPCDYLLGGRDGGPERGEAVLWLGDSGMGKSQLLINVGIHAARLGHRVAHFQLEGTKRQCLDRYDAAWTGTLYHDVKNGVIDDRKFEALRRIIRKMNKSEIYVEACEKFNGFTIVDLRNSLLELKKLYGKIDVIIVDYLELIELGDGINYSPKDERFRQTKIARKLKELAMEFDAVLHTATQASSVSKEEKDNIDFVYTRYNLSEDKGKIRPFDIFFTMNQTSDEKKDDVMRLYADKLREYKSGQIVQIANNLARSRFYDRKRTIDLFLVEEEDD